MKVAKLVRVSLVTRVIVDVDATEQDIMEMAIPKLSENLMDNPFQCIDEIVDDLECPLKTDEIISDDTIELAGKILSMDNSDLRQAVLNVINHEDENDLIDNIDGVQVSESMELKFTCEEFLTLILFKR